MITNMKVKIMQKMKKKFIWACFDKFNRQVVSFFLFFFVILFECFTLGSTLMTTFHVFYGIFIRALWSVLNIAKIQIKSRQ